MSQLLSEIPVAAPALPLEDLLQQAVEYHRADRLLDAERLYRAVLAEQPTHAAANHGLGGLMLVLNGPATALPCFQAAIQANPNQPEYWVSCIDALLRAGLTQTARQMLDVGKSAGLRGDTVEPLEGRLQAMGAPAVTKAPIARQPEANAQQKPSEAETAEMRGLVAQKRSPEAESLARALIARYPHSGYGWNILGLLQQQENKFAAAAAFYQRALEADRDCVEPYFNLGRLLLHAGGLPHAEGCFRRAIELFPDFLDAHFSLGETLTRLDRHKEAELCYRRVLELHPNLAQAHNNLAISLRRQMRPEESEASCYRALECKPDFAEACCNLGGALTDQGRLAEAAASYRHALEIMPTLTVAHHGLLFCLSHGAELEPAALFAEHVRFAEHYEAPLASTWTSHTNQPDPERVLRVGFVSGDLRTHAMAHFIEPLFRELAKDPGLSLHVYSNHGAEDRVTYRMREHIPKWQRIFALSHAELAARIQNDGIDILIDLTGHTAHNRLLSFARRPAPVQCGWIGYLGTSGLRSIDYYLADPYFLPPGQFEPYFTEQIVHLPIVAPFQPSADAPAIELLPALRNGHFTIASFSRLSKLSQPVIALWAQLLLALPEARMLLAGMPRDGRYETLNRWFEDEGISPDRIEFRRRCSDAEYLAMHHEVDLCVDPFPFTGATTTCNALWMGVPTLTLNGQSPAGRLGPALLHHVGLSEFVAETQQQFVATGVRWARDLHALAALRSGMRERFLASPVGQPATAAQGLSSAFRQMWRRWCAAQSSSEPSA
jgi:protein O-GlcNAc transferase